MTSELFEIRNLHVCRGKSRVLEVDELTVSPGEVLAVVGPNGAGKSTLLLTLARLIPPVQGKILFQGIPIHEWDDLQYRRQMAIVFQEPLLIEGTVIENVTLGLRFRGVSRNQAKALAEEWLIKLNIAELASRQVKGLSGGEAQRVSLARAFVLDPLLLLLDEPFSALDPPARLSLLNDLTGLLNQNHRTTLFVTHHLKEAERLGDRVAVLIKGTLRQIGTVAEIQNNPIDEEVASFINIGE